LIRTKHGTGGNAGKKRIGNLTGSTGHSNANGSFHEREGLDFRWHASKQKHETAREESTSRNEFWSAMVGVD
jgi:hypothetical protein